MCTVINKARKVVTKRLTRERWIIVGPDCAICGHPIVGTVAVLEVLVTTEMAEAWDEVDAVRIYAVENCVLVHPGECQERAATSWGHEKCIANLLTWQGYSHIESWMDTLERPGKVWLIERKKYLRNVMRRMLVVRNLTDGVRIGTILKG